MKMIQPGALKPICASVAIVFALALTGCGSDSNDGTATTVPTQSSSGNNADKPFDATKTEAAPTARTIHADLKEWSIATEAPTVKAGAVLLSGANMGTMPHDLVVVKSSGSEDGIGEEPKAGQAGTAGQIPTFAAGSDRSVTVNLKPGKYVLFCDLPGHYEKGMHTTITAK